MSLVVLFHADAADDGQAFAAEQERGAGVLVDDAMLDQFDGRQQDRIRWR